jgi:hypothetical protein
MWLNTASRLNLINIGHTKMKENILIFPGGMPRSLEFLEKCKRDGINAIGASSVPDDPVKPQYPRWVFLPNIVDPGFEEALKQVIAISSITSIFTPHAVVWDHLNNLLTSTPATVALVNAPPQISELIPYRAARRFANSVLNGDAIPIYAGKQPKANIAPCNIAAIFRHAETIPGMCDHDKIRALIAIANDSPQGDIVEIGTWWGKSAFVFLQLARLNRIGNVLCVDPWSDSELIQGTDLVDAVSAQYSADEAFEIFLLNMLPYVSNNLNYLRMPSTEAVRVYQNIQEINSPEFGSVRFDGRISILHVDGNHAYEAAKADIEAWAGFVEEDGWIIIDDYVWPFGDGPKRVGEEFKSLHASKIKKSFVMGSALFIQMSCRLCL